MSASREKKQRLSSGEALTQKELKERKEAEAAKRKTITYWIVGIVVVILVAALLIWDSGLIQRNMTAATIGGENLSVAEMQYYYNSARQSEIQQQQMYSQYGISILSDPYVMYDSSSALGDEQVYNTESGQTYADHFKESALNNARRVIALNPVSYTHLDVYKSQRQRHRPGEGALSPPGGLCPQRQPVHAGSRLTPSHSLRTGREIPHGTSRPVRVSCALRNTVLS